MVHKTGLSVGRVAERGSLQRPVVAAEDRFGERDVVAADERDVLADEWREAADVLVVDLVAIGAEMLDGPLGVDRVVEDDAVDDESERAELLFLPVPVWLAKLALVAVEYVAAEVVAAFAAVELADDRPAVERVVAVVQAVHGFGDAADLRDRLAEGRQVAGVASQRSHQLRGGGRPLQQAARDPEDVVVVLCDQPRIDPVGGDPVELAVVGVRVEQPEAHAAGVREPGEN